MAAIFGFISLSLVMTVSCTPPSPCRLTTILILLILTLGFQVLTFISVGTEICRAFAADISCKVNEVTPKVGGFVGAGAVVLWILAFLAASCLTQSVIKEINEKEEENKTEE